LPLENCNNVCFCESVDKWSICSNVNDGEPLFFIYILMNNGQGKVVVFPLADKCFLFTVSLRSWKHSKHNGSRTYPATERKHVSWVFILFNNNYEGFSFFFFYCSFFPAFSKVKGIWFYIYILEFSYKYEL